MNEEIYPNAPIVLMVAEIKHTKHEPLDEKQIRRISEMVKDRLPVRDDGEERTILFEDNPDSGTPPFRFSQTKVMRWSSRDRRTVLTIKPESFTVETTLYHRYLEVRELLEHALTALAGVEGMNGVTRIGLWYIDEIRVPSGNDSGIPKWDEWVDASLLGPLNIEIGCGLLPTSSEGVAVFSGDSETRLVLRYGAQDAYVVGSSPQLRRPLPSPGPLFKLDIDSYWEPVDVPEFIPETILTTADRLHDPVRSMFEGLITDKLRNEVLRHV